MGDTQQAGRGGSGVMRRVVGFDDPGIPDRHTGGLLPGRYTMNRLLAQLSIFIEF
jgi:hypothetical protein